MLIPAPAPLADNGGMGNTSRNRFGATAAVCHVLAIARDQIRIQRSVHPHGRGER